MRDFEKIMSKNRTLYFFAFLGMCIPMVAGAASSVRVLNPVGTSTTTATPVRNTNGLSTTRRATLPIKTKQISTVATPKASTATNTANTASNDLVDANRLSVIKNLKLQGPVSGNQPVGTGLISQVGNAVNSQGAASAALNDLITQIDALNKRLEEDETEMDGINTALTERLDSTDSNVDGLQNTVDGLSDISTKFEELKAYVDTIVDSTNGETVAQHTQQIQELQQMVTALGGDFDNGTVTVADTPDFDPSILD